MSVDSQKYFGGLAFRGFSLNFGKYLHNSRLFYHKRIPLGGQWRRLVKILRETKVLGKWVGNHRRFLIIGGT